MSVTVTRTKTLVPRRRPDLLTRPRLNSLLDDVLDYPFTLISAPAGYGKTSLMIDLAHQADFPVCWFSIDPLDIDPNRFLTHFIHAIQVKFPEFGTSTLSLLDDQTNPLQDPDQLISNLINEIYLSISEHFILFLDDFHHLNTDRELCTFISRFGQAMDDNTHLVMASRTLFDFPDLTLLIGRRMVKGIGYEELAFSNTEIKSYYKNVLKRDITDEDIAFLIDRTEGWITGVVFCAETDMITLPGTKSIENVTGADLFQYLAEQVFEKQPHPIQDFLLRSSLLDEFDPALFEQVFGQGESNGWSAVFSELQNKNLFVLQVEAENSWFRYHALFRDFLRDRFRNQFPEKEQEILTRILDIHKKNHDWEKAYETALKLENPVNIAEVIENASSDLIHQGRIKLLSSWLAQLPDEGYDAFPKLYLLQGFVLTELGSPLNGNSKITTAIESGKMNNSELMILAYTWRATSNRILGNYKDALDDALHAIHLSKANTENKELLAETYREAGIATGKLGNNLESINNLKKSIEIYQGFSKNKNSAQVRIDLGYAYLQIGDFKNARNHFEKSLTFWGNYKNKNKLSLINNNLGYLALLRGEYKKANIYIRNALLFAKESANTRMQAFSVASLGDLSLSLNMLEICIYNYEQSTKISDQIKEGFLRSYLALNLALVYRYKHEFEIAFDQLQIARTYIAQGSSQNELGAWHMEMGYHHLARMEYSKSYNSFLKAEDIFIRAQKPIELAKTLTGLVLASRKLDHPFPVQQHLERWRSSLNNLETLQPLLPELQFQYDKIGEVIQDTPPDPILNSLLRKLNIYREKLPRLQREIFPEQDLKSRSREMLSIIALGDNRVSLNDKRIRSSEWIHQKTVRELFFYLLTLPRGASKEQIGLVFWPDSSASQLNCQFKNAIYRLRKSLGKDVVLYDPDTRAYLFNRGQPYYYDVEAFNSLLQQAEKEIQDQKMADILIEAVDRYSHPYAPQLDGVWAEPLRQNLFRKYEQALLTIAEFLLKQNRNRECLEYCRKLLDIDPCQEKAYQLCMKAYSNLDDRINIVRIKSECINNLNLFFGIEPSKETKLIFEKLIG